LARSLREALPDRSEMIRQQPIVLTTSRRFRSTDERSAPEKIHFSRQVRIEGQRKSAYVSRLLLPKTQCCPPGCGDSTFLDRMSEYPRSTGHRLFAVQHVLQPLQTFLCTDFERLCLQMSREIKIPRQSTESCVNSGQNPVGLEPQ
jgi:hypothetical protein